MSAASSQTSLCSPNSVPTVLPNVDMTTDWCAIPSTETDDNNATSALSSAIMDQCCDTSAVQSVGGCEWCYYQDSTAKNSGQFNQDFAACLRREATVRNSTEVLTHYCNTPGFSGKAARDGDVGWRVWVVVLLVGFRFAFEAFV